jgi:hypothetical protein
MDVEGGEHRPLDVSETRRSSPALQRASNTCSPTVAPADLLPPEVVENRRESIAMLPPGVPARNRDETLELLGHLEAALP